MSTLSQVRTETKAPHWLIATVTDPDLAMLALFCAIGLIASLYVMLRFPDFSAVLAFG
jgi:hypothetical protein